MAELERDIAFLNIVQTMKIGRWVRLPEFVPQRLCCYRLLHIVMIRDLEDVSYPMHGCRAGSCGCGFAAATALKAIAIVAPSRYFACERPY